MKIQITKKINNIDYSFEVENAKGFDALFEAALFSSMPDKCGMCKSENVHLSSNKAKEYFFVKMICKDCNARSQLGQYKDKSGYYWKEWEKYIPQEKVIEQ